MTNNIEHLIIDIIFNITRNIRTCDVFTSMNNCVYVPQLAEYIEYKLTYIIIFDDIVYIYIYYHHDKVLEWGRTT